MSHARSRAARWAATSPLSYTSGLSSQLLRAGQWLAHSGIQSPNGGVARYYRADLQRNQSVSTEITGYALSAFVFLHEAFLRETPGREEYLNHARCAARFLTSVAWDPQNKVMPFEVEPAAFTYFFDCGIIVRGLLALWRLTRERELLDVAASIGESMARDFVREDGGYWPILSLPDKRPLEMDAVRWSRSAGCYQLKAALAWRELGEATGDSRFGERYESALEDALATHETFLPGDSSRHGVMDRLHAYLYFLEGLLPRAGDPRCAAALAQGIGRVSGLVEEIETEFARCDVLAQLLRVRLCVSGAAVEATEASRVCSFQNSGGGYYFGRKAGEWIPHVSPVATSFAMQALAWWERRGALDPRAII
jgi:hypothetical protein